MAADAAQKDVRSGVPAEKTLTLKDKKRIEAEERNRISKMKSALKKELAAVEEKIAKLEARKAEHEKSLCDPQTHRDAVKIKALQIDLKACENELEASYPIWTEISCKLEEETPANTG
jgi:ATP-binding cassette, subfamily F, member 3